MDNRNYCVYMHTNKINGKKYIGITGRDPEIRWNNGFGYYRNKHFFSAIKKYGWDSFEHEILAENLTSEEACGMEKDLIKKYNSNSPNYGYNICNGGETNILPKESLEKISKANKGRKMTDEQKLKRSKNPPKAKAVVCDGKKFISIIECAKYYNINPNEMRKWLYGTAYVPEEFIFKGLNYIDNSIKFESVNCLRKWVYCDGMEFHSIPECARYYGIPTNRMQCWIYGIYQMPEFYKEKNLHQFYKTLYKAKKN